MVPGAAHSGPGWTRGKEQDMPWSQFRCPAPGGGARHRGRWSRVSAVVIAVVAISPASASALIVRSSGGHKLGVVPAIANAGPASEPTSSASAAACTTDCTALIYHGNAPVQHAEKEYLLFWVPNH